MSDVHVIDALTGDGWHYLLPVFFDIENERQKSFDIRKRDIVAIRPLDEWLSFEIQDGNETRHWTV